MEVEPGRNAGLRRCRPRLGFSFAVRTLSQTKIPYSGSSRFQSEPYDSSTTSPMFDAAFPRSLFHYRGCRSTLTMVRKRQTEILNERERGAEFTIEPESLVGFSGSYLMWLKKQKPGRIQVACSLARGTGACNLRMA